MKTKEELNALKEEVETMSRKRRELTEEELEQVTGGEKRETGEAMKQMQAQKVTLEQLVQQAQQNAEKSFRAEFQEKDYLKYEEIQKWTEKN